MPAPAHVLLMAAAGGAATFDPLSISGCALWLDASDAASFTFSSGTLVSQWNDLSGNARHVSQATTTYQPSRNGSMNGLSTVVFDGTDDYLYRAHLSLSKPMTIFVVAEASALATVNRFLVYNGSGTTGWTVWVWVLGSPVNVWAYTKNGVANTQATTETATTATPFLIGWTVNASPQAAGWEDGTSFTVGTETSAITAPSGELGIGNRTARDRGWTGEIAEVLIYDTELSTGNRQSVESYLMTKWGI